MAQGQKKFRVASVWGGAEAKLRRLGMLGYRTSAGRKPNVTDAVRAELVRLGDEDDAATIERLGLVKVAS